MTYTGLSLSLCVSDILDGLISEDDVVHLIAGIRAANEADFTEVVTEYRRLYWWEKPDEGEAIARRFWTKGLIDQPRLRGEQCPWIKRGHWKTADGKILNTYDLQQQKAKATS